MPLSLHRGSEVWIIAGDKKGRRAHLVSLGCQLSVVSMLGYPHYEIKNVEVMTRCVYFLMVSPMPKWLFVQYRVLVKWGQTRWCSPACADGFAVKVLRPRACHTKTTNSSPNSPTIVPYSWPAKFRRDHWWSLGHFSIRSLICLTISSPLNHTACHK